MHSWILTCKSIEGRSYSRWEVGSSLIEVEIPSQDKVSVCGGVARVAEVSTGEEEDGVGGEGEDHMTVKVMDCQGPSMNMSDKIFNSECWFEF